MSGWELFVTICWGMYSLFFLILCIIQLRFYLRLKKSFWIDSFMRKNDFNKDNDEVWHHLWDRTSIPHTVLIAMRKSDIVKQFTRR